MNCKKIIAIFVFCYFNCCIAKRSSLPSLVIDKNLVTVSGLSSGAYMAVQLHIAYSSTFKKGVGVIAGGPYYCAEGQMMSTKRCMDGSTSTIPVSKLVDITRKWAKDGRIDPLVNPESKVYIFTGTKDSVVVPSVSDKLYSYYTNFVKTENIVHKKDIPAEHSIVTDNYGNTCSYKGSPYINNCGFDTVSQLFETLYGRLNARNYSSKLSGSLFEFDQTAFVSGHGMGSSGWVYVPKNCAEGQTCKLHVALHGCVQNAGTVDDAFYKHAGYNQWADTNNIVVLYPQTGILAINGCWDWWGYDSPNFAQKSGPQMTAIKAMVDRIASGSSQPTDQPTGKPTTGKPTTEGTAKPTAKPTANPTAKPTESPKTYTDNNYNHVVAGRAYIKFGNTYAKGSNDFMGLYNIFVKTTLKQIQSDYYVVAKK